MPVRAVSAAQQARLSSWPQEIAHSDLAAHFTLTLDDLRWLRALRVPPHVRLALAVLYRALPFLGYLPADLAATPPAVAGRLARRLGVPAQLLDRYPGGLAERSRREHTGWVLARAGWRVCGRGEWKALRDWLLGRAVERDDPALLFTQALEYLHGERIVRPGLERIARTVAAVREEAGREIRHRLAPLLTAAWRARLDSVLVTDPRRKVAPLVWLSTGATSPSPDAVKNEAAKLRFLRALGTDRLDLSAVPPERLRQMAAVARKSTPAALRDLDEDRRYPMLLAALSAAHTEIVDELVQLFDQALAGTGHRAKNLLKEQAVERAAADQQRLGLLDDILVPVLDDNLDDTAVGAAVRGLGRGRLEAAARAGQDRTPRDGGHLQLIEARYAHVRSFAPPVLAALTFSASVTPSEVLAAVELLQAMNADSRRRLPEDAPVDFIPARWRPYLDQARGAGDENLAKHYWELATLFELQSRLRSGEIWVHGSRRYTNPASYLIPPAQWPAHRDEVLARTGRPAGFAQRLTEIDEEIAGYLDLLEPMLASGDGSLRRDPDGTLHLKPLAAEVIDATAQAEVDDIYAMLPTVPLTEILIEADRETNFTRHFTHAGGARPRVGEIEHRRNLYAAVLAQACNFGATRMAELTGIPADTIEWTTRWYLSEANLRLAHSDMIDAHFRSWLAQSWGGGTLSSSDGLRLPMRGKSLTARALSRYFLGEGLTSYTHVSDQHTTFGTQIIVSTDRDAPYVLDEILGNTTELPLLEHATDTHGQTLISIALFDLVGKRLSPRIAKLTEQRHWRSHPAVHYQRWPNAGPILTHPVQAGLIAEHWDDLQRIAGSLLDGHVSAALLIARLQAGSRQHPLAKALLEYGKLLRTAHALRWYTDEAFRRRIGRQLNRGETLNDLRRFIFYAERGKVRYRQLEDQTLQAHCNTLVVNACILSTTGYLEDAITCRGGASDTAIALLSPAHFEAINPYGDMRFDVAAILARTSRRPLRRR